MDPFTALMIIAVVGEIGMRFFSSSEEKKGLELQKKQARVLALQHDIRREKKMEQVLAARNVASAQQGVTGGSFSAANIADFEAFAEDQRISDLNSMMKQTSLSLQESNVMNEAIIGSMGDIFGAARTLKGSGSVRSPAAVQKNIVGEL
jgi:hypothetical protein